MSYFDDIKKGDRVWDFIRGWGKVERVEDRFLSVSFNEGFDLFYTYEGYQVSIPTFSRIFNSPTLFWDEVKIKPPKKPKIELKVDYSHWITTDRMLSNKEFEALIAIKRTAKLLSLRDQECPNSRGYKFIYGKNNFYISKTSKRYVISVASDIYDPTRIYFNTEKEARAISNILNKGKFNLKEQLWQK